MDSHLEEALQNFIGLALGNGAIALAAIDEKAFAKWVEGYDFIIAVFPEAAAPGGLVFFPVKGLDTWRAVAEGRLNQDIRSNAIPCVDRAAARALLARFGNPAWENETAPPARVTN